MLGDILSLISMVISIALICFLAYFVTKKLGTSGTVFSGLNNGQGNKKMCVCDKLILAPNKSLVLVKVANRFLLLGVSNENISLITEIDAETAKTWSEENTSSSPNFADVISQMLNKNKKL